MYCLVSKSKPFQSSRAIASQFTGDVASLLLYSRAGLYRLQCTNKRYTTTSLYFESFPCAVHSFVRILVTRWCEGHLMLEAYGTTSDKWSDSDRTCFLLRSSQNHDLCTNLVFFSQSNTSDLFSKLYCTSSRRPERPSVWLIKSVMLSRVNSVSARNLLKYNALYSVYHEYLTDVPRDF